MGTLSNKENMTEYNIGDLIVTRDDNIGYIYNIIPNAAYPYCIKWVNKTTINETQNDRTMKYVVAKHYKVKHAS